ncbi:hypothetical protein M5D96_007245 [Drosophila gunungcola]|uniref:Uncharacterized protein n=1 Tax=Drosophila gunungcola TaxID=103775 RepID=A0A9P9YMU1_9MUSC|nr:hypothetical protein M5D96_007245 [Drosophila gunungcola]
MQSSDKCRSWQAILCDAGFAAGCAVQNLPRPECHTCLGCLSCHTFYMATCRDGQMERVARLETDTRDAGCRTQDTGILGSGTTRAIQQDTAHMNMTNSQEAKLHSNGRHFSSSNRTSDSISCDSDSDSYSYSNSNSDFGRLSQLVFLLMLSYSVYCEVHYC